MAQPVSNDIADDKPKEQCGVFGIRSRELAGELAQRTYFGLYALQHRGQEAAGIAVSDGETTLAMRDTLDARLDADVRDALMRTVGGPGGPRPGELR